jgi:hypothetical protein
MRLSDYVTPPKKDKGNPHMSKFKRMYGRSLAVVRCQLCSANIPKRHFFDHCKKKHPVEAENRLKGKGYGWFLKNHTPAHKRGRIQRVYHK